MNENQHGNFAVSGVADQSNGRDAEDVQDPGTYKCAGNQQKCLGKAAFFANQIQVVVNASPSPSNPEQASAMKMLKRSLSMKKRIWVDVDVVQEEAQYDLHTMKEERLQESAKVQS